MRISRNLSNLCRLLKEQYNWRAIPQTFKRTYAGRLLKSDGAFSWTMDVISEDSGVRFEIGSCYPLSAFSRKDIVVDLSTSWHDYEISPEAQKND